jgi:hypothetical protein
MCTFSTAIHEAGHAVAQYVLGIDTGMVSVLPQPGSLGRSTGDEAYSLNRQKKVGDEWRVDDVEVKKDIIVLFAGYAAQVRWEPAVAKEAKLGSATDDRQANDLLECHLGLDEDLLREEAAVLLGKDWLGVVLVARELLVWKELDDLELEHLIELSRGDEGSLMALARYRAVANRIEHTGKAIAAEHRRLSLMWDEIKAST